MKTLISLLVSWPIILLAQNKAPTDLHHPSSFAGTTFLSPTGSTSNPGALGFISGSLVGINSRNRFGLKQLTRSSLNFQTAKGYQGFMCGISCFGYELYNETSALFGYGLKLHLKHGLGISGTYTQTKVAEQVKPSRELFTTIGYLGKFDNWLLSSQFIFFWTRQKTQHLNDLIQITALFSPDKKLSGNMVIDYYLYHRITFCGSMKYELSKAIQLWYGLRHTPFTNSIGVAWSWSSIRTFISSDIHQNLGWSPAISIGYQFKQ